MGSYTVVLNSLQSFDFGILFFNAIYHWVFVILTLIRRISRVVEEFVSSCLYLGCYTIHVVWHLLICVTMWMWGFIVFLYIRLSFHHQMLECVSFIVEDLASRGMFKGCNGRKFLGTNVFKNSVKCKAVCVIFKKCQKCSCANCYKQIQFNVGMQFKMMEPFLFHVSHLLGKQSGDAI